MAISSFQTSPRGTAGAPATSVSATFTTTPTVGRWVVALVNTGSGKFGGTPTGWTLTDNQGNTYTQRAFVTADGNIAGVWTAPITTSSGTFTATATMTGSSLDSSQGMTLLEVSALNAGSLVDLLTELSEQVGYATSFNVTTSATTDADELVIALAVPRGNGSFNTTPSPAVPPTNYTTVFKTDSGNGAGYAAYRITTATGAQSINFTGVPIDGSPGLIIVSFRGAAAAPTINTQPNTQRVPAGSTATFTVSATASGGSLSYQWQSTASGSWANVSGGSGATTASYTTATLTAGLAYRVRCVVTDSNGSINTDEVDLWTPVSKPQAWAGLYGRGGQRDIARPYGLVPTSKAAARATSDAIFDDSNGISGSFASTLAGATMAASGAVNNRGSFASTLDDATMAASGSVAVNATGTLASTLAGASMASSGTVDNRGALASTLAGATMAASGTVTTTGAFASTLAGAAMSAAGAVTNVGAFGSTLAGATMSAGGTVGGNPSGTFSSTLAGMLMASSGQITVPGLFASTLSGASMAASGLVSPNPTGTFASTLGGVSMSAAGFVGTPPTGAANFVRHAPNPRKVIRTNP